MNWLSQTLSGHRRHAAVARRSGSARRPSPIVGIAGVVIVFIGRAVDRRGFQRGDDRAPAIRETVIVLRAGSDTEMTSGFWRRRSAADHRNAPGIEIGTGRPHRLAGALRHRRPSAEAHRHRRQRAAARRLTPPRCRCARRSEDRRGPDVRAGHATRSSSAAPRRGSSPVSTSEPTCAGARTRGRSSGSSTPAAASPSPRSGATRRCCSRRIAAATPTSRSTRA